MLYKITLNSSSRFGIWTLKSFSCSSFLALKGFYIILVMYDVVISIVVTDLNVNVSKLLCTLYGTIIACNFAFDMVNK